MSAGKGQARLAAKSCQTGGESPQGSWTGQREHDALPDPAARHCWQGMQKGNVPMATAHREQLIARHARLDASLAAELKRPLPDPTTLRRLKREKLKLKDEIGTSH
jgi:hypothetical protein